MSSPLNSRGFTLIELAIVLVIVGVLAGSFITTLSSRIDSTRIAETSDEIDLIKQALFGFAYSQPAGSIRIPCPDCNNDACVTGVNVANDGIEDHDGNVCDADDEPGNVPWVTLGVGRSDAWGTHFSYWASDDYTDPSVGNGFTLASDATGDARVDDTTGAGANTIADRIAAVIFSHGKDGYDGISEDGALRDAMPVAVRYNDQRENNDIDAAPMLFISRPITPDGANVSFDDVIDWISEYEIKARMADAQVLP